ncbi:alpha/beta fold hydrolase [Bacillus sp. B190/17]|uniref:Alpha/beta fold hydrolase n=1 Tax=Bacillus lumedeiriae TaxID=3058829 RepID=A0ABW8IDL7_9BACI
MKKIKRVGPVLLAAAIGTSGIFTPSDIYLNVQAQTVLKNNVQINAEEKANLFMSAITNEKWAEAYSLLSDNLKKHVSQEQLPEIWKVKTAPFGKLGKQLTMKETVNSVHTNVVMTYEAEMFPIEVTINLDQSGNIDDFYIPFYYTPPSQYEKPAYEQIENYIERQVAIGSGEFSLPGTLTLPKGNGPFPAVVLVHGSGPNDQDESLYSTKPFRDIAVGLANHGIAVLRYEKVTREHHIKTGMNPKLSLQEETVHDAIQAVQLLHSLPEINHRVYVLGHSQGGYALPRIVEADKNHQIHGGIVVSGPSGKFQDLMLWQQLHALEMAKEQKLPAEQLEAIKANLAFWEQQIALINNSDYSKDNIPKELQLPNQYWWYELRDYVPAELAAKQTVPLFIMQGEKDLQVPSSELNEWKNVLDKRQNVSYKLYPDLIHLLVNYKGKPDYSEYSIPANVPEEFIQDIADWIEGEKIPLSFSDVNSNFWAYKEIKYIAEKGYINGYPNGTFQPNRAVTRAQAAKILANALQFDEKSVTDKTVFKDVGEGNEFLPYIRFLHQKGIMSGYTDGTFQPNEPLTRAQIARILATAFQLKGNPEKPFKDVRKDHWAAHYIDALAANGIAAGNSNGTFGPAEQVTRAQTAAFLYRTLNR